MKTGLGWNSWRPLLLTVGDQAIFLLSLAAALAIRQAGQVEQSFLLQHLFAFLPLFVLWQLTLYAFDLYDFKILREMVQLINMIWIGGTINLVLGMAYFYLLQPYLGLTPKTHLLLAAVLAHIGIMAWRRVWVGWMQSEGLRQRVVLLAYDRAGMDLRKEIEAKPELGYQPVEWISPEVDLVVAENSWVQAHWDRAQGIIAETLRRGVPFIPLDTFRESLFGKVSIERASDPGWVLEFALPRSTGIYAAIKRPVEGATALLLLLLLAPALAAISVVLWCFEGRPLYYSQRRLGLLGSEFTLWKFRTMIEQADSEGPFSSARAADPRITRFGAWLRRFRLDELPQLWNVVVGDMALVGPRPEWVREVEVLEQVLPQYHLRHLVRPGITGWAQVYFRATNSPVDSLEKLQFDLYYLKYMSFAVDVSILLKTLKRVFMKDAVGAPRKEPVSAEIPPAPLPHFGTLVGRPRA